MDQLKLSIFDASVTVSSPKNLLSFVTYQPVKPVRLSTIPPKEVGRRDINDVVDELIRLKKKGSLHYIRTADDTFISDCASDLPTDMRRGFMLPVVGERRDDCARYSTCMLIACKRDGHSSCPKSCAQFSPESRSKRLEAATTYGRGSNDVYASW